MAVITISRQLGSLGGEVGQIVAAKLGYQLISRELINQAAKLAGMPELALAVIDELGLLGMVPTGEQKIAYTNAVAQVMNEIYQSGNAVIIGRGGQVALRGKPGVIHVRIIAPFDIRASRVSRDRNIPINAAVEQIKASDKNRSIFLKSYYNTQLDDLELYDLILNTGRISPQESAEIIIFSVEKFEAI